MNTAGRTKRINSNAAVILLIAVAAACLPLSRSIGADFFDKLLNFIRSFIYIGLFAAWGVSIRKRVMQPAVRRYLTAVSLLMVLWLVIRDFKWRFVTDPDIIRKLWYSYYIPMILIPLLALFVSMHLGRTADHRHPPLLNALYAPAFLLIAAVWTNDIHQKVFAFPDSAPVFSERDYSYGILYAVIVGWGALCTVAAFVMMLRGAKRAGLKAKVWLPVLPMALAAANIIRALLRIRLRFLAVNDTAVFFCLVFLGFFEACIRCGLIQSNSRYAELFLALGDLKAVICDRDYVPCYGGFGEGMDKDVCVRSETERVLLPGGQLVRNMRIDGGHVLWTEDISGILALREKLKDTGSELKERNDLLKLEYERDRERRTIEEQNRLYALLGNDTKKQISMIEELTLKCIGEKDEEKRRDLIRHMILLGCYVKRRKDLLLTIYESRDADPDKLVNALGESFLALKACGIYGSYDVPDRKMASDTMGRIYSFFEEAAESLVFRARYLNLVISQTPALRVSVRTDMTDPSWAEGLQAGFPDTAAQTDEDGSLIVYYPEGAK